MEPADVIRASWYTVSVLQMTAPSPLYRASSCSNLHMQRIRYWKTGLLPVIALSSSAAAHLAKTGPSLRMRNSESSKTMEVDKPALRFRGVKDHFCPINF